MTTAATKSEKLAVKLTADTARKMGSSHERDSVCNSVDSIRAMSFVFPVPSVSTGDVVMCGKSARQPRELLTAFALATPGHRKVFAGARVVEDMRRMTLDFGKAS
jgi:hypothetical protein